MLKKTVIPEIFLLSFFLLLSCNSRQQSVSTSETGYYKEKYRPQYHFSPDSGWMNDPNGLFWFDNEYHLFYQHYPDSTVWGPMHWGHAVSKDLVHWEHLPVALYPDSLGYIFSGSAVVDKDNTSGFGSTRNPPVVAVFTYHDPVQERNGGDAFQNQAIAYSTDKGRSWTKYSDNPVLKNPGIRDFRDPKVFWHKETSRWIMILAVRDRVHLYSSPDLKKWSFESEFGEKEGAHGGVWECPDLFPLKVDKSDETRWVMLVSINPGGPNGGSATQYFTGDFDGKIFFPDGIKEKWLDWGPDNYAGVTWSGIPESDGRRLFIGWMSNWNYANVVPASTWRSAMTLPRELVLEKLNGEYTLLSKPAEELKTLRQAEKAVTAEGLKIKDTKKIELGNIDLSRSEIKIVYDLTSCKSDSLGVIFESRGGQKLIAGYSRISGRLYFDRTKSGNVSFSPLFKGISSAPYNPGNIFSFRIFLDTNSAELFIDDGKLVMTGIFFPDEEYSIFRLFATGGKAILENLEIFELSAAWR